ncbi:hypothetical protein OG863_39195 [Streptomyces decoyicus]|uniref:Uncharacterized protein n=1 Tax=Streptomyces decoyicus TaxID=249567 RepID=A0ABZ1FSW8_9ACTN|nr:hypothetical protein [Streptomyces decoyicus]WSB73490.1 hypothetical protein OG863_39195 [Streptomyces decoyicus]
MEREQWLPPVSDGIEGGAVGDTALSSVAFGVLEIQDFTQAGHGMWA